MRCKYFFVLLVAVAFVGPSLSRQADNDPCNIPPEFNSTQVITGKDAILECFNSIPANDTRIEATIAVMRQMIQLYAFTDIINSTASRWKMNIDLSKELDAIAERNYTRDYDFQLDLSRLFLGLHDAHTGYNPPQLYVQCTGVKPFSLFPILDGDNFDTPRILLVENVQLRTLPGMPDFQSHYGDEVVEINGQEVLSYLKEYAYRFVRGWYKDLEVRFNSLFRMDAGWSLFDGVRTPLQDAPNEILLVKRRDGSGYYNFTIPVIAICQPNFNGSDMVIHSIDLPSFSKRAEPAVKDIFDDETDLYKAEKEHIMKNFGIPQPTLEEDLEIDHYQLMEERLQNFMNEKQRRSAKGQSSLRILDQTVDGAIIALVLYDEDGKMIPVLKMSSFRTANNHAFYAIARSFNHLLQEHNFTHVILDVTQNGGGDVCLSLVVPTLFSREIAHVTATEPTLWTPHSIRKSPLTDAIFTNAMRASSIRNGRYMLPVTGQRVTPHAFYVEDRFFNFSDIPSRHTQFGFFPEQCAPVITRELRGIVYWPTHVIITTDGMCGSACSVFLARMARINTSTIITHGGYLNEPNNMQTASFAGGNVLNWANIAREHNLALLTTSARVRFAFHQAWSTEQSIVPLEFDAEAFSGQYHIRYWDAVRYNSNITANMYAFEYLFKQAAVTWGNFAQPAEPLAFVEEPYSNQPFDDLMPVPEEVPIGEMTPVTSSIPIASPVMTPTMLPVTSPSVNIPPVTTPLHAPSTSPIDDLQSTTPNQDQQLPSGDKGNNETVLLILLIIAVVTIIGLVAFIIVMAIKRRKEPTHSFHYQAMNDDL